MENFDLFDSLCVLLAVGTIWRVLLQVNTTASLLMYESEKNWKFILLGDNYFLRCFRYNNLLVKVSPASILIMIALLGILISNWWSLTVFGRLIIAMGALFLPMVLVMTARVLTVLLFYAGRLPSLYPRLLKGLRTKKEAALG